MICTTKSQVKLLDSHKGNSASGKHYYTITVVDTVKYNKIKYFVNEDVYTQAIILDKQLPVELEVYISQRDKEFKVYVNSIKNVELLDELTADLSTK